MLRKDVNQCSFYTQPAIGNYVPSYINFNTPKKRCERIKLEFEGIPQNALQFGIHGKKQKDTATIILVQN